MQYVQNLPLPPTLNGLEDNNEVKKLTEIKPVNSSAPERTQPSMVLRQPTQSEPQPPLLSHSKDEMQRPILANAEHSVAVLKLNLF